MDRIIPASLLLGAQFGDLTYPYLNGAVLHSTLKRPDEILRALLKVEAPITRWWTSALGRGDWATTPDDISADLGATSTEVW